MESRVLTATLAKVAAENKYNAAKKVLEDMERGVKRASLHLEREKSTLKTLMSVPLNITSSVRRLVLSEGNAADADAEYVAHSLKRHLFGVIDGASGMLQPPSHGSP